MRDAKRSHLIAFNSCTDNETYSSPIGLWTHSRPINGIFALNNSRKCNLIWLTKRKWIIAFYVPFVVGQSYCLDRSLMFCFHPTHYLYFPSQKDGCSLCLIDLSSVIRPKRMHFSLGKCNHKSMHNEIIRFER